MNPHDKRNELAEAFGWHLSRPEIRSMWTVSRTEASQEFAACFIKGWDAHAKEMNDSHRYRQALTDLSIVSHRYRQALTDLSIVREDVIKLKADNIVRLADAHQYSKERDQWRNMCERMAVVLNSSIRAHNKALACTDKETSAHVNVAMDYAKTALADYAELKGKGG